ncbi:MAG: transposase [Gemmataceae bacterium]
MRYINRTGCQWRALPHDFPPKGTVTHYYKWMTDGTWDRLLQLLRKIVRAPAQRANSQHGDD